MNGIFPSLGVGIVLSDYSILQKKREKVNHELRCSAFYPSPGNHLLIAQLGYSRSPLLSCGWTDGRLRQEPGSRQQSE